MLSGILFEGLSWLHFHEEIAKVNADNFAKYMLLKLADACRLAFQQDMAHGTIVTQEVLGNHG